MNLLAVILISLSSFAVTSAERSNSIECMNWVLRYHPTIKNRAEFIPEQNILVETVGESPKQFRIFHTEMGTFVSWDEHTDITCDPTVRMFDGQVARGYYQYTALALSKTLREQFDRSIEAEANSVNSYRLEAAMRTVPVACANSHESISDLVSGYCDVLETRPNLQGRPFNSIRACR